MAGTAAKAEKISLLHAKFAEAKGAILSDYRGMNVQQMSELRNRLREVAIELHVVKNTLAQRATEDTTLQPLAEHFTGPTAVALTFNDVVAMAKVLTEYAKSEPKLEVKVGLVEGQILSSAQIVEVAELPPREILLARMLASMQSPLVGLVGVLQGVIRKFLYVLVAIKDAKEQAAQ